MTRLRQLWLLTALGSVVVLAAGYFLMVSPQTTKAASLKSDAETQLAVNKQIQSQIDMLNKQKVHVPEQQRKLSRFAGLIPPNPAMPALLRALSDAADNAGVELLSITPTLPTWAKGVNAQGVEMQGRVPAPNGQVLVDIPVALYVAGHYSNLTSFFAEVEDLNRALLVSDFKVERPDGKVRKQQVEIPDPDLLTATIGAHVMMTTKAASAPAKTTTAASSDDVTK